MQIAMQILAKLILACSFFDLSKTSLFNDPSFWFETSVDNTVYYIMETDNYIQKDYRFKIRRN